MKLTLVRVDANDRGLFGKLITDGFECVTLERHDIAVPCGTYRVTLYQSPSHGLVPLLHDVPGRSMIEIHEGNFEWNSKGCILVAARRNGDCIENSRVTLRKLVAILTLAKDDSWIEIRDSA